VAKTCFFWDELEDNIVEEFNESGVTIADYTTEPDLYGNVISQHRSGQSSFLHHDALGSVLTVTDESQNITDTRAYSAFGETTEASGGTVFPFHFVGENGYYAEEVSRTSIARRRCYQPVLARWVCPDPRHFSAGDGNLYRYVGSNPSSFIDPSGLECKFTHGPVFRLFRQCKFASDERSGHFGSEWTLGAIFAGVDRCGINTCECCEYRQYVGGYERIRFNKGKWIDALRLHFQEDYLEDTLAPFGHRHGYPNVDADNYKDKFDKDDRLKGCRYRSYDNPGLAAIHRQLNTPDPRLGVISTMDIEIDLEFRMVFRDVCNKENVWSKDFAVKCWLRFVRTRTGDSRPGDIPGDITTGEGKLDRPSIPFPNFPLPRRF
jgi:RHS repeat-associated protein